MRKMWIECLRVGLLASVRATYIPCTYMIIYVGRRSKMQFNFTMRQATQ